VNTTTITNVHEVDNHEMVELGTFVWIGDISSIYILGRMAENSCRASLIGLSTGNLWHLDSYPIVRGRVTKKNLEALVGPDYDWGFISEFTVKQERE